MQHRKIAMSPLVLGAFSTVVLVVASIWFMRDHQVPTRDQSELLSLLSDPNGLISETVIQEDGTVVMVPQFGTSITYDPETGKTGVRKLSREEAVEARRIALTMPHPSEAFLERIKKKHEKIVKEATAKGLEPQ